MTVIHASRGSPVLPVGLIPSEVSGGFCQGFHLMLHLSEVFKFKSANKHIPLQAVIVVVGKNRITWVENGKYNRNMKKKEIRTFQSFKYHH